MKTLSACLADLQKEPGTGLRGLVFDIDGVMLDSRASNMEFYNLIRRILRLPPLSPAEEEYCHMASVEEAMLHIIPPAYREAAWEACRKIDYPGQILPLLSVEPGLTEILRWLKRQQVKLAIFTNRSSTVHELLRHFDLEDFFDPVATASDYPPKPSPEGLVGILKTWDEKPGDIAFLGDSKVDEQAARGAGVPFWSFRNQELQAHLHFNGFFDMMELISPLVEKPGQEPMRHARPAAEDT
ncbi:MAG: HAD family hydrolase [Desulfovibrio sp.]|jgi:phosphoglycolate phosphatase-like HAD superfamily hydrolase|nr:HAD family hydrolase [Desulfovibrio sp.]